jgi:hypothetical protein
MIDSCDPFKVGPEEGPARSWMPSIAESRWLGFLLSRMTLLTGMQNSKKPKKGEEEHVNLGLKELPPALDVTKITALMLDNNQLSGKSLAALFSSPSLKVLSARHNWVFKLPPEITQAKKLSKLELEVWLLLLSV